MKAMIFAAIAALSLGAGVAYAQGGPVGFQGPGYGHYTGNGDKAAGAGTTAKGG